MKKKPLAVVAALSMLAIVAPQRADAVACPPGCVISGVVEASGIVPDPNKLFMTFRWKAVDLRGATPQVRDLYIRVEGWLTTEYTPTGPKVSRGYGMAYVDTDLDHEFVESAWSVEIDRTGYPALNGTYHITAAKAHPDYGTYVFNVDLDYIGFSDGTKIFRGVAAELVAS